MTPTDLDGWLTYIGQIHLTPIDLTLERVAVVAARMGLTEFPCPVVTVAGTNGKGSSVACLESIFLAGGYRVGAFTSPHLVHCEERIRFNGVHIDVKTLCDAFKFIDQERRDTSLSFFEFWTVTALWLFQQAELDVLLLEVGLGGRLDAVNVVDADLALISSIGIDHVEFLGDNRESIGFEKAGVFRQGKPVVCGDPEPPVSLLAQAKKLACPLYRVGCEFDYLVDDDGTSWAFTLEELAGTSVAGDASGRPYIKQGSVVGLPMPSLFVRNAASALMASLLLGDRLPVDKGAISRGLASVYLPGRFQRLSGTPPVILDVAHNPESGRLLAAQLQADPCKGKTHAVVAMLADKDIEGTLTHLAPLVDHWYVAGLDSDRGADPDLLLGILNDRIGAKACYNKVSVRAAYQAAREACADEDRIVVFGSFHTVGAIYENRS